MKITINNMSKAYAEEMIFDECSFEIVLGSKVALVGENGSGKSTLLKMIAGIEPLTDGNIFIPKDCKVGYLRQEFDHYDGLAIDYIIESFTNLKDLEKRLQDVSEKLSETENFDKNLKLYGDLQSEYERLGGYEIDNTIERISDGLSIREFLQSEYQHLSGGEKTRIELVRLLASDTDVLCLDEPTNHLDFEGIEWLESYCLGLNKTLIIVSHDRHFLNSVATVYFDIEDADVVKYHGNFESFRQQKQVRFETLVNDYKEQEKIIHKIQTAIRRFRQWGHESDNPAFFKKAKTLEKKLERMNRLPKPEDLSNRLDLSLNVSKRSGKDVLQLKDLAIGYDSVLQENINFKLHYQERHAIIGTNGSGKSTLIKTILNEIEPLSGSVHIGSGVTLGYIAQENLKLDEKERLLNYTISELNVSEFVARQNLARFGFYQSDVYKTMGALSGGEKVRIQLMILMHKNTNFIILDEPTNHLDIKSCEILEDVLATYEGSLLIVSHDRYFLERLNVKPFYLTAQ